MDTGPQKRDSCYYYHELVCSLMVWWVFWLSGTYWYIIFNSTTNATARYNSSPL